jgi:ribose transport system substrate-binding protein
VHAGLVRACERERLELIVVDNRYQPRVALRNAEHLIREKVDLVIEFQTDEAVAPAIASRYLEAEIPLIAIDIPHPGATYFGANNYQAGLLGGRYLGKYAQACWHGQVDEILLLELARAGGLVRARCKGIVAGIKETARGRHRPVVPLDWRRPVQDIARSPPAHPAVEGAYYRWAPNDPSARRGAARSGSRA